MAGSRVTIPLLVTFNPTFLIIELMGFGQEDGRNNRP